MYLKWLKKTAADAAVITGCIHGDHLSGKPGNVREFETCLGNVRDVVNSQGIVREMSWKSVPKLQCSCTKMHSLFANTLNNNTIYLTLTPEVLAVLCT